jgi:hypothetical protein
MNAKAWFIRDSKQVTLETIKVSNEISHVVNFVEIQGLCCVAEKQMARLREEDGPDSSR